MGSTKARLESLRLDTDLFLLSDGNRHIAYAPLKRRAFEMNKAGAETLKKAFETKPNGESSRVLEVLRLRSLLEAVGEPQIDLDRPLDFRGVCLSLTSSCNLRCRYCYAHGGDSAITMPWVIARCALKEALRYSVENLRRQFRVTFHGGGEPTMTWDLLVRATEYAHTLAAQNSMSVMMSIVTNGTLIDDEKAEYFAKRQFRVSVSIDGLKEIHDYYRPDSRGRGSFDSILIGLRRLTSRKVPFGLRATITQGNIGQMEDLVRLARETGATKLHLEPLSITGRAQVGLEPVEPNAFVDFYRRAADLARSLNVRLEMASDSMSKVRCRFCSADGSIFCVLPNGSVSSCTRVTHPDDSLAETFIFGRYDGESKEFILDQDRISDLRHLVVQQFVQCKDCFCQWNCAGGCHHSRLLNGGLADDGYCSLTKDLIWSRLAEVATLNGGDSNEMF